MTAATITFLGLGAVSYILKAAGPVLLGGRPMPESFSRLATLVPGPLLAALVLVWSTVDAGRFVLDARLAGVAAAAIALRFRANFLVTVIAAAVATAVVRQLS